jgi:hypothetical protein
MRTLACWALILAMMCVQLPAQPATDARHAEKIRNRVTHALEHHYVVSVETADHRQFQGLVSEIQPDHFVLALQGHTTTLTYAEVEQIKWQQHMPRPVLAVLAGTAVAGVLYGVLHLLLAKNG